MNRCDRSSGATDCRASADKGVVEDKLVNGGGTRPKTRRQASPKAGGTKNWTGNQRRNGEGKFGRSVAAAPPTNSTRSEKSGAFDSLLKRAHRRRSSVNAAVSEKATGKQGARDDDDGVRQGDSSDLNDKCSKPEDGGESKCGSEDAGQDVSCWNGEQSVTPAAEPVEYTILPRPERRAASVRDDAHPPSPGTSREDGLALRPLEARHSANVHPVSPYEESTVNYAPYSPTSPQECSFFPPEGRRAPLSPPPLHAAPGCIADEPSYPRLGDVVNPALPYQEILAYSSCPPPVDPSLVPVGVSPFHCPGFFPERPGSSRRRTRSFPRRLPERRLYDSHGRWTGQERRPQHDLPFDEPGWLLGHDQRRLCRDGCSSSSYFGGRHTAREPRPFADLGRAYSRRHSWSYSSVPDDDIEDLLPLIDKFGIEQETSDSSAGSSPEVQIPDEGSWFSVLPETAKPEDRYIWSPRRDLHRPKSVWSPIKPRLGCSPQDGLREQLTRIKYRSRTYTGNAFQGCMDAFMEGRRSVSCELPCESRASAAKADDAGWSPWSFQLPTADLLNAS